MEIVDIPMSKFSYSRRNPDRSDEKCVLTRGKFKTLSMGFENLLRMDGHGLCGEHLAPMRGNLAAPSPPSPSTEGSSFTSKVNLKTEEGCEPKLMTLWKGFFVNKLPCLVSFTMTLTSVCEC